LNLKKSASLHYAEQEKLHQLVLTDYFEKHFEKTAWFCLASQAGNFGTLPPLLNKPMGFKQNSWKNSSKIVLSKVLPTSRCRDYALRFHWYMHIFYLIQYKF